MACGRAQPSLHRSAPSATPSSYGSRNDESSDEQIATDAGFLVAVREPQVGDLGGGDAELAAVVDGAIPRPHHQRGRGRRRTRRAPRRCSPARRHADGGWCGRLGARPIVTASYWWDVAVRRGRHGRSSTFTRTGDKRVASRLSESFRRPRSRRHAVVATGAAAGVAWRRRAARHRRNRTTAATPTPIATLGRRRADATTTVAASPAVSMRGDEDIADGLAHVGDTRQRERRCVRQARK